ncbi:hypothetical protein K443DRAFT_112900, partial [Laccaria amethystina LaAM-08-1]
LALGQLQYLGRWKTSCTCSCFGINDVSTLRHQIYTDERTVPQVMNQRQGGSYSL